MSRCITFEDFVSMIGCGDKIDAPIYWDGCGFHFYSMLHPVKRIAEAKSKRAMEYAERVLKNYTQAASDASRAYGSGCCILEHQGWVIHFYLHTEKRDKVVKFARLLAALVDGRVMEDFDEVTLQFHMAAEYGRSILIGVDSSTEEEASKSCVSLGPCANAPAKKMGDSTAMSVRPLWIRMSDDGDWEIEDCHMNDEEGAKICESVLSQEGRNFATAVCRAQSLKEAVEDSPDGYLEAYCFRADMDGFTKAVKKAFESTSDSAVIELVRNFVGYMQAVNAWQAKDPVINMVPYPWAGDCCTMLARPNYGREFSMEDFEASQKMFPIHVFNEWNAFIKQQDLSFRNLMRTWRAAGGNVQWVSCVSGGVIYPFDVKTADRKFRVMVGWPVGVSHKGVNIKNMVPDSLVLHNEDFEKLEEGRKKRFKKCEESKDYYYATRGDLAITKQEAIAQAGEAFGATTFNGVCLRPTRPWGGS